MELWPHQARALREIEAAMLADCKRILVTSPTGGGKSLIMEKLLEMGFAAVLYTNRRMLLEQTADRLAAAGFSFGMRAAGVEPSFAEKIQLASIQTEHSRCFKAGGYKKWALHDAQLVLIDEAHVNKAGIAQQIVGAYAERGVPVVGVTATPLDLDGLYDRLIVAGTTSELRACGALVPAVTYAPDEPAALATAKMVDADVLTEQQVRKAMPPKALFGRVFEHWQKLNPDGRPTILFAPGVAESRWFAEQFHSRGVPAAHIDGADVWIRGEFYQADQAARDMLRRECESGGVKIVCNRFVLREGIDWPFLYHGIFATAFGSLASYIQSGGRILRAHPSLDHVVIQDHGGNWWRHGSLNADREWSLSAEQRVVTALRRKALREKRQGEPIVCPKCAAVRLWGRECPQCHHVSHGRVRQVLQSDGTLKEVAGDIYKPRRTAKYGALEADWRSIYYRAKNTRMTFEQAKALFAKEHNWLWPPETLPLMPTRELDHFRRVADVPLSALRGTHADQPQERRGRHRVHETGDESLFGSELFG